VVVQKLAGACWTDETILIGDRDDGSEGRDAIEPSADRTHVGGDTQATGGLASDNNHEEERLGEEREETLSLC
jgi:hypothetical protein